MFQPGNIDYMEMEFQFSKKFDGYSLFQSVETQDFRVLGVYKLKVKKTYLVDLGHSMGSQLGREVDWEYTIKANETTSLSWYGKYSQWLIPKFSDIEEGSHLMLEHIEKLQIESDIIEQERDLFLMILFNQKVVLAWDFSYLGKVKPEVTPL